MSELVPEAEWLLTESPAPPVLRMLTEYLPGLAGAGGEAFQPPEKQILDSLKKGVWLRNKITHTGYSDLRDDTVEEVLTAVEDVLWRLDVASGLQWAERWYAEIGDE